MGQGSADDAEFVAFVVASQPRLVRIAYLMCSLRSTACNRLGRASPRSSHSPFARLNWLCGDWQRAEDVVQTVLARLYPRWSRVCTKGDPLAYVRQGLLNAVIDERRRPWRRERPVAEFAADAAIASDVEVGQDALPALARIPARQRAVVVLRYVDGLSVAEVAHELGISEGTVKSQAARGIAALRAVMTEEAADAQQ